MRLAGLIFCLALCTLVSACGFKPVYAVSEDGTAPIIRQINVASIAAPEEIIGFVTTSMNDRISTPDGVSPKYDLYVETRERAQRLAVQIDATITRFNYRLIGRYTVVDRETGKRFRGRAEAVTSYNIVTSIYSTLFAEQQAREKAANLLAEEIERDLLIRLANRDAFTDPEDEEELEDSPNLEPDLFRLRDSVPDPEPIIITDEPITINDE